MYVPECLSFAVHAHDFIDSFDPYVHVVHIIASTSLEKTIPVVRLKCYDLKTQIPPPVEQKVRLYEAIPYIYY